MRDARTLPQRVPEGFEKPGLQIPLPTHLGDGLGYMWQARRASERL